MHPTVQWEQKEWLAVLYAAFDDTRPLFPLPILKRPSRPVTKNRRSLKRYRSRLDVWNVLDQLVSEINFANRQPLSAGTQLLGRVPPDQKCRNEMSIAQAAVMDRLLPHCKRCSSGRRALLLIGAAARALFSKVATDFYGSKINRTPYVPPVAKLLAEPPVNATRVEALVALDDDLSAFYAEEKNVLAGGGTDHLVARDLRRVCGRIGGRREEYIKWLWRPDAHAFFGRCRSTM